MFKNLEYNRSVRKLLEGSLFLDENIIDEVLTVKDLLDFCDRVNIDTKNWRATRAQEMLDQASRLG